MTPLNTQNKSTTAKQQKSKGHNCSLADRGVKHKGQKEQQSDTGVNVN